MVKEHSLMNLYLKGKSESQQFWRLKCQLTEYKKLLN